jgi:hypothetical protein
MSESSPADCLAAWRFMERCSTSVHFLLLISSDFILVSPTGRDDSCDFFAIDFLPVNVNDEYDDRRGGVQSRSPDGPPPLFPRFVNAIQSHKAILIFENERRHFEWDAVLFLI